MKTILLNGLYIIGLIVLGLVGCKRSSDPEPVPVPVKISESTDVFIENVTTARLTTLITGGPVGKTLTVGYVWSKTRALPTLSDAKTAQPLPITTLPSAITAVLTGLDSNAAYSVRAYATLGDTTTYGTVTTVKLKTTLAESYASVLNDALRNRDIGYGFVIFDKDVVAASGTGGFRSRSVDPEGPHPYTLDTKMHIASMSKTLAAIAFMHLAAAKGIRTTDRIGPYLPPNWSKGENIDQVTFRDLLTHRSGIIGLGDNCQNGAFGENTYAGLRLLVAKGVKTANRGQYCYQNANVGLFRILIPALTGYVFTGDATVDAQQTQQAYINYVQQQVLAKVGLTNVVPTFPSGEPTYTYDFPYSGRTGWNPGSFYETLGGYGWYLSPREAGTLFAKVLSSDDQSVLSAAYKDTLLLNNLGCYRAATSLGSIAYHDGWWYFDKKVPYVGLRTIWMKLPNNLTAVLFVNALDRQTGLFPSGDGTDIVPFMFRAYERARQGRGGRLAPSALVLEHPEPH